MLKDPTNQIPRSSSNPGSSTQPSFNQMPYYPNYQPQFATQEELLMFQQFKMQQMHQQQPQQSPNQFTTSQKRIRNAWTQEQQVEKQKRIRNAWTQDEELLLAKCFIQVSEDPKTGCDQKRDTFWYKIQNVYNTEAKKKGFTKRTKNMLTGKWTPMNTSVLKFNQLVQETVVHSKHKWTNPDSTLQRRSRLMGTDEEPAHFGNDELPRPPGLQRLAKSQRSSSNSTASSGSNSVAYQELMAEQYKLDRKAKIVVLERESKDRRRLIQSQMIAEDMRVL
ncbi:hypothetical protein Tco_1380493 [Tanacetum coccineum]